MTRAPGSILALGRELTIAVAAATFDRYRNLFPPEFSCGVEVRRASYGPHSRHRLSIFRKSGAISSHLLLFVPGGGLAAPEMAQEGSPYFDNIGLWAAQNGLTGVTMTTRLAPEARWPAGARGIALAIGWLRIHASKTGIDPDRIVLMGHSAGAGHVATYCANPEIHGEINLSAEAIILVSGPYYILSLPRGPNKAYYADDPRIYPACNTLPGLVRAGRPLFLAIAENDPPDFELQALELMCAWHEGLGRLPCFIRLPGHNHFSIAAQIGAQESRLTEALLAFLSGLQEERSRDRNLTLPVADETIAVKDGSNSAD